MLVKLTDFPEELAAELKGLAGTSVASKAVMHACQEFIPMIDDVLKAQERIALLEDEVHRLRGIIEGARSAAALLVEKTGQGDLLEPVPFLRKVDHFED